MMSKVTESLAGRINLIDLYGLSLREVLGDDFRGEFMPAQEFLAQRKPQPIKYNEIWDNIWRGFFPEIVTESLRATQLVSTGYWQRFYSSYMRTYLDRDVSKIA